MPGEIPQISEVKRQMQEANNAPDEVKERMKTPLEVLPSDVEKFLHETGLTEFEESFKNEELSLNNILKLTDENLKDIGISKLRQRIQILESIENFKAKPDLGAQKQDEKTSGVDNKECRSETAANLTMSSKSQAIAGHSSDDCSRDEKDTIHMGTINTIDKNAYLEEDDGNKNNESAEKVKKVLIKRDLLDWLVTMY